MNLLDPSLYFDSNGQPIQNTSTVKDLGVHITNDLTFDQYIHTKAKRGKKSWMDPQSVQLPRSFSPSPLA